MLKHKRVIGIVLAVIFIISFVPMSIAQTYNDADFDSINAIARIEEMLGSAAQYPEQFEINFGRNIELGSEINVYRLDSELHRIDDIKYYPVLSDSRVVAIVNIHGDFSDPSISLGKDFAEELQVFLDFNESFALVYEGSSLYAVSESQSSLLKEGYDDQGRAGRIQSLNMQDLLDNLVLTEILPLYNLTVSVDNIGARSPFSFNLGVPLKLQGVSDLCWAACVASIGQYMTGVNKTAAQVAVAAGIPGGATILQSGRELSIQYGRGSTVVYNAPSYSTIMSIISSNRPIYGAFSSPHSGHAVVLSGYEYFGSGQFMMYYMDPNIGFRTTSTTTNGSYSIVVGSVTMTMNSYLSLS